MFILESIKTALRAKEVALLSVVAGSFLAAGCAGATSPSPAGTTAMAPAAANSVTGGTSSIGVKDGCAFLSKQEVERVFGEPFKEPRGQVTASTAATAGTSGCVYESIAQSRIGNSKYSFTLALFRYPAATGSATTEATRATLSQMSKKEVRSVSNLGDAALWADIGQGLFRQMQFYVFKGDVMLQISLTGYEDEQAGAKQSEALARTVFDRL